MRIVTHNGPFHADDVFATAILRLVDPAAEVTRTRDPQILGPAIEDPNTIVVDVGATMDATCNNFDHHQRGGAGVRANEVPYAAAGLLWRHFGRELCDEKTWSTLDVTLFQGIDALDCGYAPSLPEDTRYAITSVSHVVSSFNPLWDDDQSDEAFMEAFEAAVEFATNFLRRKLDFYASKKRARAIVHEARVFSNSLVLSQYCPWQEAVLEYHEDYPDVDFVIFPQGGIHMIMQIPKEMGSFAPIGRQLPSRLAGLRNEELQQASGVEDAVFVHPGRFCGGAVSLLGARALAQLAIKENY